MDPKLAMIGKWYEACDPARVVSEAEFKRQHVPLDSYEDPNGELHELRGPPAVDILMGHILVSSTQVYGSSAQLFSGYPGTGKTTELALLAKDLRKSGFTVLHVDAQRYINGSAVPTPEEMVLILAAGIGEAAENEPILKKVARKSTWQRIWDMIDELQVDVEVESKVNWGPVEIKAMLKRQDKTLRQKLTELIHDRPSHLRVFLHERVLELVGALPESPLAVLMDGLEKFYFPETEAYDSFKQMSDLFLDQHDMLRLPKCHVVYTVPPYIGLLNRGLGQVYGEIRVLCSVKTRTRGTPTSPGEDFAPGLSALKEILGRRVNLPVLFGASHDACATALARASGGHVRDMLILAREVIAVASRRELPLGIADVDRVIQRVGNGRANPLLADVAELLGHVKKTCSLQGLGKNVYGPLCQTLAHYLVLSYYNGEPWYDVHPLVRERVP